ncbi:ammonium transporter [Aerosakkonemataceae cyanobacterium BLCC-F154]|uniref:Ammonium transporter n=1 Tax=Floridaenema fluviatile BLCC-F154 TaxID=3153640 RepID=A0ABV4YJ21_9CYAN
MTIFVLLGPMVIQSFAQDTSPSPSPSPIPSPTLTPETSPTPLVSPSPISPVFTPPESTILNPTPQEVGGQGTAEVPRIDSGNAAWMLICSALVLLMTPGLAFFYGGLVRSRNVLNTMMMSFMTMAIVGVIWILWGYSLAFAPNSIAPGAIPPYETSPILGSLNWAFLRDVAFNQPDPIGYAPTIPHQLFMIYQMMFAIIAPAIISGAIVERVSFKAYFWFIILWSTFIYSPLVHWVWGKGWLETMGVLDFAGGTVIHISSGVSALVAAWVLGARKTYPHQTNAPHNIPYALLGIALLWFGWLGLNGGRALASGELATVAIVATTAAAAAGGLTWSIMEWVLKGKPSTIGIASGFLAGLVSITPAAGYVTPMGALLIGSIACFGCFWAVNWRVKWKFDDSLDTFSIFGVGGTIGTILTGFFATKEVNSAGSDGLLYGNPGLIISQFGGVIATVIFAAVGTLIIWKLLGLVMPLRVKPVAEDEGLDINEHGEEGYGEEFISQLTLGND